MLNIKYNRREEKWNRKIIAARAAFGIVRLLIVILPRQLWGVHNAILKIFKANIARDVRIYNNTRIFAPWNLSIGDYSSIGDRCVIYNLGQITIGKNVTISQNAHLCAGTHDYQDNRMTLVKSNINISDDVWICADAFIGPGVTIGKGAVVGARAVVTKDVSEMMVVAGNPAKVIKQRVMNHA